MTTVRGTQPEIPAVIEFGKDTVYERRNIRRIEEAGADGIAGFSGWEYEEAQYSYPEYAARQEEKRTNLELAVAELAALVAGGEANG